MKFEVVLKINTANKRKWVICKKGFHGTGKVTKLSAAEKTGGGELCLSLWRQSTCNKDVAKKTLWVHRTIKKSKNKMKVKEERLLKSTESRWAAAYLRKKDSDYSSIEREGVKGKQRRVSLSK